MYVDIGIEYATRKALATPSISTGPCPSSAGIAGGSMKSWRLTHE